MKLSRIPLLIPVLAIGLHAETDIPPSLSITPEVIDRLLAEAQRANPGLQAAEARKHAAEAAVGAVRQWDDPTVSFGLDEPTSRGFKASEDGNLIYGVSQKLPLFGLPEQRRRVADADAVREKLSAEYRTQLTRRDLVVALSALALADTEADLAVQNVRWLEETLAAVDHRYRVGKASQVDWLKVQTAHAAALNDLTTRQFELEHHRVALNRILNRELHAAWPNVVAPGVEPALHYTPRLAAAALNADPRLKVRRQESAAAAAAADLTHRQRLPDVSVGVEAAQYSGDGGIRAGGATVSLSIPWLNSDRYDSGWRRDRARQRASELDAEDLALSIEEETHHAVVDLDAARRQALLYRDEIIPLTEQTLRSARSAWENNLGLFQDVLESHRMLLEDQGALARALDDQARMLADLALLTGTRDVSEIFKLAGD